jgi:hypothetical protein
MNSLTNIDNNMNNILRMNIEYEDELINKIYKICS